MDEAIERLRLDLRRASRRCRQKREAYPAELRARVAVLASEWVAGGRTLECLATRLVMASTTLYRWVAMSIKPTEPGPSMIPVRVVEPKPFLETDAVGGLLTVTSPTGWRVDGLRLDEVVGLMSVFG